MGDIRDTQKNSLREKSVAIAHAVKVLQDMDVWL